ncbi:hypothetical protein BA81_14212 [Bacillus safensis FO-36b]|uniref:hypothetical protein n=1 Tax=Bacillus safensis TaxID=561879 RepID=UPI00045C83D7|nr:hypothetical protein [Bacillus safensis]AWI35714.1 hypothetical protein RS87_03055 [Bacillus safensis FO-36b]KDE26708.1 hypothetical protein BA81_14212 [Bacillus safensis FO-36b]MCM3050279.1 hypothetical protein [Bacillus safensis]MEC1048609.1 hypothetical protein [Bacillus safensis]
MSEHVLKEFETLREAVEFIKDELKKTDERNTKNLNVIRTLDPSSASESMEEGNMHDNLFLLYSIDDGPFFVFETDYDLESWLESDAWDDWNLWERRDIEGSLNEDVMIWKFHRDICKEKWEISYRDSKPFINGWSRQRKNIEFRAVPSFSLN